MIILITHTEESFTTKEYEFDALDKIATETFDSISVVYSEATEAAALELLPQVQELANARGVSLSTMKMA